MASSIADGFIAFGTVLGGVGALVAGLAARRALNTWRTQLKAQTRFDSARRLLVAAHELAQKFHGARSPFVLGTEYPAGFSSKPESKMTPDERANGYAEMLKGRWEPVRVCAANIVGLLPEAEALLPPDVSKAAKDVLDCVWKLRVSMGDYVELMRTETGAAAATPNEQIEKEWRRVRRDIYAPEPNAGAPATDNPLTTDFVTCHQALVKALRSYVDLVE